MSETSPVAATRSAAPPPVGGIGVVYVMVTIAGVAALSWELLWQHFASLALGVSAQGTAITLAATMGGMTLGAIAMGRVLPRLGAWDPIRIYGLLEVAIGLSGLLLQRGFLLLEALDSDAYQVSSALGPLLHLAGVLVLLAPPTVAMGAAIPVFGKMAKGRSTSLSRLYGLNVGGAALGVLLFAFLFMPSLGVELTTRLVAVLNLAVGASAFLLRPVGRPAVESDDDDEPDRRSSSAAKLSPRAALVVAATTGWATFTLEVAWFRSLRAAFHNTTDAFALILASVLIPLAISAHLVPVLKRRKLSIAGLLAASGVLILLATPVVERFDVLAMRSGSYALVAAQWFGLSLVAIGPSILVLGTALPWLLDDSDRPSLWGRLYAVNSLGAVAGSIVAAWVLLPILGFARASWVAGGLVVLVAIGLLGGRARLVAALAGVAAVALAVATESGVGRDRVQDSRRIEHASIVAFDEGPDSTISVVEDEGGARSLMIDGFEATSEAEGAEYMEWMGRLPMLLHESPRTALVICFGTGQTANGVRREGPERLDVVELNPAVLSMAHHFTSNESVLEDPRVRAVAMDGRAWLRRSRRLYDVVTLEPMPPHHAGVNALYSVEFYRLVAARLEPGGIVAQWVPLHLLPPSHTAAITAAFTAVFPDALLWDDPYGTTAILVGRAGLDAPPIGEQWPGFRRQAEGRELSLEEVRQAVSLRGDGLRRLAALRPPVTDENQLLAYGRTRAGGGLAYGVPMHRQNMQVILRLRAGPIE